MMENQAKSETKEFLWSRYSEDLQKYGIYYLVIIND